MSEDTRGRAGGPRNVLYLTDDHDECDEVGCMDLLGADAPEAVDVLFVTVTRTARERLATWRRHADAPPANVGVVSVETGGSGADDALGAGGPTVRRVSDPSDLTGVGIAISEFLSEWAGNGNRTVVCFDSLTALLQYVDQRRVFQFCNEITSKFETAGAAAHFHIAPEAHDRQVLSVLASLFDDRVSAADLGHAPRGGGGPDEDPPARASGAADPSAARDDRQPAAAAGDRAPPDDPAGTDEPDESVEGSFVFAGDQFGREATADGDDSSPSGDRRDEPEPSEADEPPEAGDVTEPPESAEGAEPPGSAETDAPAQAADTGSETEATDADAGAERHGDDDPGADPGSSGAQGGPSPGPEAGEEAPAGSTSEGLVPRTTATVVGVVVMLLLMSFFAAAFPAPLVLDEAGDGVDGATATPEDAASGAGADATTTTATVTATATATGTATQSAAGSGSPTETATSTSTPTPDGTPTASSPSSTTSDVPTPTATTEPVSTETGTAASTPTPTPEDAGILDDPLDTL